MNSPLIERKLINALFLVRDALVFISSLTANDYMRPGLTGDINYMVIKKSNPKKIYGPYKEPNVPLFVWERMKQAKGMNGSGAGTELHKWRRQKGLR